MPLLLVATPGASNANAYADVATADSWALFRVGGSAWAALTVDQKIQALVTATQDLDALESAIGFCGVRASDTQALAWPRTGTDFDDDTIPTPLVRATIELAMSYAPTIAGTAVGDVLNPATNGNIKREKVASIEVEYWAPGESAGSLDHYPRIVRDLLQSLICIASPPGYGMSTVVRTS